MMAAAWVIYKETRKKRGKRCAKMRKKRASKYYR